MKRNFSVLLLCGAILMAGIGCERDAGETQQLTEIDKGLKLFVQMPTGWKRERFNTLYKNPKTSSGFSYVPGGLNYGFGPTVSGKNMTRVLVHVIAIPKAEVGNFEKNRYPPTAERVFETGEFVVYVSTTKRDDVEVKKFVESLVVREQ